MKVTNMTGNRGHTVRNQFIISGKNEHGEFDIFQSYNSVIVKRQYFTGRKAITYLDETYWDYSVTTGRYRNKFLGEKKTETERKIASGEYVLVNLNNGG